MNHSPRLIERLAGAARWRELFSALREASASEVRPYVHPLAAVLIIVGSVIPSICMFVPGNDGRITTMAFGSMAVLAVLLRRKLLLSESGFFDRRAFRLTHTAFALGCIPAVLIVALNPSLFRVKGGSLGESFGVHGAGGTPPSVWMIAFQVVCAAGWIAVTEELVYRGMLLSTLRRIRIFTSQRSRDIAAVSLTAILFGAAHFLSWGAAAALALAGLGAGFGLAYLAVGERLTPVIVYHFLFDLLSMTVALVWFTRNSG